MFTKTTTTTTKKTVRGTKGHPGIFGTSLFEKPDTRTNGQKFFDGCKDVASAAGATAKKAAKGAANFTGDLAIGIAAGAAAGASAGERIAASQPQTVEVERSTTYGRYGERTHTTTTTTSGYGSQRRTTTTTTTSSGYGPIYRSVEEDFNKLYNEYRLCRGIAEVYEGILGTDKLINSAIENWNMLDSVSKIVFERNYGTFETESYKNFLREEKERVSRRRTSDYI